LLYRGPLQFLKDELGVVFFAYSRLKKVAYGSMATFFILRICFESNRHSHPLNCVGLFLGVGLVGLLLWIDLLLLRLLSVGGLFGLEGHL
jgi:hypothetical protein